MDIKVIGSGCERCESLYANTREALAQLGMDVQIQKVEDLLQIVLLGVMSVPALMVDGKILLSGRTASAEEIRRLLKNAK